MISIVYGVIADARTIQRRRRRWILAAAAALVAAAVGLGIAAALRERSAPSVELQVALSSDATPAEIRHALGVVKAEPGFADVDVISAAEGLKRMKARYPLLVAHLTSNPLPTSLDVHVRTDRDPGAVARDLRQRLGGATVAVRFR